MSMDAETPLIKPLEDRLTAFLRNEVDSYSGKPQS